MAIVGEIRTASQYLYENEEFRSEVKFKVDLRGGLKPFCVRHSRRMTRERLGVRKEAEAVLVAPRLDHLSSISRISL